MKNRDIAAIFERLADLLELKGENPFKIRAYRKVAGFIGDVSEDIGKLVAEDRLREVPGVGEAIGKKIAEIVSTGKLGLYERLRSEFPEGVINLLDVPGVGPKTALLLVSRLGIKTVDELESAIVSGTVAQLPGMGEKSAERILLAIRARKSSTAHRGGLGQPA